MYYIQISKNNFYINGNVKITGSKSESNRFLILKALYPDIIELENISNSDDTFILKKALFSKKKLINIKHSGTAMRFLTAFFSIKENREVILTGSYRMQERPISILVETLKKLGGKIFYEKKNGYPPLRIMGNKLLGGEINIDATISSQYISALMLIASKFENGLKIYLSNKITSISYINMTLKVLKKLGINVLWNKNIIYIKNKKFKKKIKIIIESDWSSASYYYSLVALSKKADLNLKFFNKKNIQGDSIISNIYKDFFNVKTFFNKNEINLKKIIDIDLNSIDLDLNSTPDIAQTIVVTCTGLKIKCVLRGLETLKIKETDRLNALKNELSKLGVKSIITNSSIELVNFNEIKKNEIYIYTYDDHRMAMSFSTLGIRYPISILNYNVVSKSYPNFWIDLKSIGFFLKKKKI
ncbi:3-phosphoshikimate 1-carboxyvinyltransferase [Candidatus Karelsulcia muelleri]|uniref:3-phosphoshikimate 1-carboxyvinyltransferase n=1 Tax=Candidatus Karelsulcia muelleri TaxID=336810 RepID=UPI0007F9F42F|nr:3-phosphoshikimate 1-carboxyvinyltransferase [Candidatus Karelsulcia muelleri]ANO35782.1 3-phosphoshikimate 1-carboxyvinyltransferase [Candidatus Karelsulcia muelleri]QSF25170.1 3-phosphoshikimate 1-carboxyvinyltransferase [Candidatus Karelsulcia muelleri]WKD87254.1 3-phosphoshikimate 1-carboxyvinyltransferase [Candidatus Karelsulcia muelleri]BEH03688.1 5-enolpyruvylshikimate-3-phosphate synthetase [Candidatus Karelsulcia muelleri]